MLSGVSEQPMIVRMPSTSRPQQRYDHRLRDLVQRTGDLAFATAVGIPRSTARGWLRAAPALVVSLDVADLTEPELRQEILKLRRRIEKLAALLRLALSGRAFAARLPRQRSRHSPGAGKWYRRRNGGGGEPVGLGGSLSVCGQRIGVIFRGVRR